MFGTRLQPTAIAAVFVSPQPPDEQDEANARSNQFDLTPAETWVRFDQCPLWARSGHQAVAPSFGTFGPVSAGGHPM